MLHIEERSANRHFNLLKHAAEQEEREQVKDEISHMLLEHFTKARRGSERAAALLHAGRQDEAEPHVLSALRDARGLVGTYGPGLIMASLRHVVELYTTRGRWEDAEPFARELIERHILVLGEKHPMTIEPMQVLASIWVANGRFREATELLERVVATCAETHGQAHPTTRRARSYLKHAAGAQDDDHEGVGAAQAWLDRFYANAVRGARASGPTLAQDFGGTWGSPKGC